MTSPTDLSAQYRLKPLLLSAVMGVCSFGLVACTGANAEPDTTEATAAAAAPKLTFSDEEVAGIEARMAEYITEGKLRGIHTRLVQHGEVVSDFKMGLRGLETQAPITDDTIYRIYSMTKPVTGVAMMMLYEDGRFALDDPITKFIPEFESLKVLQGVNDDGTPILVDLERAPTMAELMSHTAGFAYGLVGADPANTAFREQEILRAPDLQTFIDQVADVPLLFQPGDAWAYSAAVDIQGYIIEKLSGHSFGDFLKTRIFDPLGMADTGFYVPQANYNRFSEVYGYHPETGELVPIPYPQFQFRKETVAFESGGGGLVSTMDDYAAFTQMLLNDGTYEDVRLLKPETMKLMRTNVLSPDIKLSTLGNNQGDVRKGIGFGLNLGIVSDPGAGELPYPKGAYFWGGAAGTWFWADPENDLYFIGMIQIFDRGGEDLNIREVSANIVYDALAAQ